MTTQQEEDSRTTQPPTTLPPQPSSLPPTLEEYGSPPLLPPPIDAPLPYSQPAPLELPRSNPDIQRKLFEAYRARLRRSYLMPLLMWLPSFAFVLVNTQRRVHILHVEPKLLLSIHSTLQYKVK